MNILYIPLDERPCNLDMPQHVVASQDSVNLLIPELSKFGNKKQSANVEALWDYINQNINDVDALVLSMDMLLYGGLIPSRLHHLEQDIVEQRVNNLKKLKDLNNNIKIYAFQCIMRSPQYDSSEEEPDYYENYGRALHRRKFLDDKEKRVGLSAKELEEQKRISIPTDIIDDYEFRRSFNLKYNLEVAKLVDEGFIDFLVIPQDDAAEYGYTALAQKEVIQFLTQNNLESRINIYPGADEVGASLLARCLNENKGTQTKVYAFYSSVKGPDIIPNYEDRPMHENLKYHLDVTHSYLVDTPEEADFILAINSPGSRMEEAFDQDAKDVSYTSFRNLLYFTKQIERYIEKGFKVSVCDSAFSNGGDLQLIKYLDEKGLLDKLLAYAGWNTNSNTLGTVLGSSIYAYDSKNNKHKEHLVYRIIEDVLYQSDVRQDIINDYLHKEDLSYYVFGDKQEKVESEIATRLKMRYNKLGLSSSIPLHDIKVTSPWSRMFEVGLYLKL